MPLIALSTWLVDNSSSNNNNNNNHDDDEDDDDGDASNSPSKTQLVTLSDLKDGDRGYDDAAAAGGARKSGSSSNHGSAATGGTATRNPVPRRRDARGGGRVPGPATAPLSVHQYVYCSLLVGARIGPSHCDNRQSSRLQRRNGILLSTQTFRRRNLLSTVNV